MSFIFEKSRVLWSENFLKPDWEVRESLWIFFLVIESNQFSIWAHCCQLWVADTCSFQSSTRMNSVARGGPTHFCIRIFQCKQRLNYQPRLQLPAMAIVVEPTSVISIRTRLRKMEEYSYAKRAQCKCHKLAFIKASTITTTTLRKICIECELTCRLWPSLNDRSNGPNQLLSINLISISYTEFNVVTIWASCEFEKNAIQSAALLSAIVSPKD